MYLLDFAKYLKRHRARLAVALVCMVFVSVFSVFNLSLVIPVLQVINPNTAAPATGAQTALAPEPAPAEAPDLLEGIKQRAAVYASQTWVGKKALAARDWFYANYLTGDPWQRFYGLGLVMAVLVIASFFKGIFEYISLWLLEYSFYGLSIDVRKDVFSQIVRQDYLFFTSHDAGFLEARVQNDINSLREVLQALTRGILQESLNSLCILFFMFWLNPPLTLLILLGAPVTVGILMHFAKIIRKMTRKQRKKMEDLGIVMDEAFHNYKIILTHNTAEHEIGRFDKENRQIFKYYMKGRVARFAASPIIEFLGYIGIGIVVLIGGWLILFTQKGMTIDLLVLYLLCLARLYPPIRRIAKINNEWQQGKVSAERIMQILTLEPGVHEQAGAQPIADFKEKIEFDTVSFAYGDKQILKNIALTIPKGGKIALVGRAGAGKTTLANLLPRLIDPDLGAVRIDGRDLRELRIADLRRLFGIVTQETVLFNDTVTNNIAYGAPTPDFERVQRAARAANAHEFILELEGGKGYDTPIGMSGARLSGGQRQRIAIARAIYRDPQILIFDEATSNLDEATQRLVQEAIDHLLQDRTAVIIAHRLSTIRHADEIIVLDEGRIIERGSHDELLKNKSHYSRLYNLTDDLSTALNAS